MRIKSPKEIILEFQFISGIFCLFLIIFEWLFIDRALVIPTSLGWLIGIFMMWVVFLIIEIKKIRRRNENK